MWLNASIEKEFSKVFKFEDGEKIVILNPGKRKRYVEHEGDLELEELSN